MPGSTQSHRMRSFSSSLPWRRPKSSMLAQDDLRELPQQVTDLAIDDSSEIPANTSPRPRGLSHGHVPHHSGGIKDMFRRASISLRGIVHRRPSIAKEEAIYEEKAAASGRPTTSHLTFNGSRHQPTVRHSRSFYGLDYTHEPLPIPERPTHTSYHTRPGMGSEPPVIPQNTGAAAKASAAMQNEYFARQSQLQNRWLYPTLSEDNNDDESGVGIAVTLPGAKEAQISKVDFVAELPSELAIHILAYLDAPTLSKASLVSSWWNNVVKSNHIWRESFLRETTGTYAMSGPVRPNTGLGVPKNLPVSDWKQAYRVKKELDQRWKQGQARPVYLNGHTDSIYCLQFDE